MPKLKVCARYSSFIKLIATSISSYAHFRKGENSPAVSCIAKAIKSKAVNLVYLLDDFKLLLKKEGGVDVKMSI